MNKISICLFFLLVFISKTFGQTPKPLWQAIEKQKSVAQLDKRFNVFNLSKGKYPVDEDEAITHLSLQNSVVSDIMRSKPKLIELTLPLGNENITIELMPWEVETPDFEVLDAKTGQKYKAERTVSYRGVVKNDPGSMAALSFSKSQIIGVFTDAIHGDMILGKSQKSKNDDEYVFYAAKELKVQPPEFKCFTEDKEMNIPNGLNTRNETSTAVAGCVRLSLEVDYELYTFNGKSIQNTVNYINGVMNVVYAVFVNEQISMTTSQIYIWTIPDTYTCDTGVKLTAFTNSRKNFTGNLAHLITAEREPDGSLGGACGGRAFVDVICNTNANYGVSDILESYNQLPAFGYTIHVLAHEIGHNLGSPHTHSCSWSEGAIDNCAAQEGACAPGPAGQPYTIMSYCPIPSTYAGFGEKPGALIRNRVGNATCLSATCTTPSCTPPTNFTLSNLPSGTSAVFTWTANAGNTSFNLQYRRQNTTDAWTNISNVTSPYTLSDLILSTGYEVKLVTICDNPTPELSTVIIFKTLAGTCLPPTNLTSVTSNTNATLSWTENAAATLWEIKYGLSGFNPNTSGTTVVANSNPFVLSNLNLNTTYDWYVRSICAAGLNGFTPLSIVHTFTTPTSITYCDATYSVQCNSGTPPPPNTCGTIPVTIRDFSLRLVNNSIVINNPNNGCQANTSDFTNIVGNVTTGVSYSFTAYPGTSVAGCYYYGYIGLWIDYNNDGDFLDNNETVYLGTDFNTFTSTFIIPNTVSPGLKRLRVRRNGGGYSGVENPACANFYDGEAEDYTLNISNPNLPVELLGFQAQNTEGGNLLTWQTATEKNTRDFEIEKSSDGNTFERIGTVKAVGNSTTPQSYSYLDKEPFSLTYYRLKINDLDEKMEYSKTVSVRGKARGFSAKVYPNPIKDNAMIEITNDTKSDIVIEMYDVVGRQVKRQMVENTEGVVTLPMSELSSGIYFLKISNGLDVFEHRVIKN